MQYHLQPIGLHVLPEQIVQLIALPLVLFAEGVHGRAVPVRIVVAVLLLLGLLLRVLSAFLLQAKRRNFVLISLKPTAGRKMKKIATICDSMSLRNKRQHYCCNGCESVDQD